MKPDYKLAWIDIIRGIAGWRVWTRLGWQEVKRRYRRTAIGPFWLTLSLGMFISGMGLVWAPLFNTKVSEYLPFVATGMVCWTFVSVIINEGCGVYTGAESLIKQLNISLSLLNWILIWRNLIVMIHNLVIVVIVFAILRVPLSLNMLLFFPGVLIVAVNGIWLSMLLGMVSARYRDVPQLVANLVQVMMFVTPVFWYSSHLGAKAKYMNFNLLYHIIEVIRAPLLGNAPSLLTYEVTIAMAIIGWAITMFIYARFRRRIAFWL